MDFLDLNLSEVVSSDSVNNLSDISLSPESINHEMQLGGGLLSGIFGESKLTKAVLEAARLKKYDVVEFLVDKDIFTSYAAQDEKGNTLLHYLVCVPNPNMKLIEKISKKSNAKSFINKQNKDGDTPLILAVKSGHHDVCSQLIESGADKKIRNKEGLHVDTETEMVSSHKLPAQPASKLTVQPLEPISPPFKMEATGEEARRILDPIFNLLKRKRQEEYPGNTSEPRTGSIELTEKGSAQHQVEPDTQDFAEKLERELNSNKNSKMDQELDALFERPPQRGGDCGAGDTDRLINAIEKYFDNNQTGGAKKRSSKTGKSGHRRIRNVDSAIESEVPSKLNGNDRGSELSRIINNQTEEIIARALKSIQQVITDNKTVFKGLKGDEETARAIKAVLWRTIKEKNPDMKSALDVAVEMEKLINKDSLKEIPPKQIKDMMDTLKKHYEEKKQRQPQQETTSPTSSEPVLSDSAISATSF